MTALSINELLIKGIRYDGSTFRPSDWAERLCGVAALLHSDAIAPTRAHHAARPCFHCSPHVRPAIICGVFCVIVDLRLRDLEKQVWDFVTGFARDNDLIMLEYCQFAEESEFHSGVFNAATSGVQAVIPNKAPTPVVKATAKAPQKVTRAAAVMGSAHETEKIVR